MRQSLDGRETEDSGFLSEADRGEISLRVTESLDLRHLYARCG
jgi:hypothetical protein